MQTQTQSVSPTPFASIFSFEPQDLDLRYVELLEPIDEDPENEIDEDEEPTVQDIERSTALVRIPGAGRSKGRVASKWPRSFEEHLADIKAAHGDPEARRSLSLMGRGDLTGLEPVMAAIAKSWEELEFWLPMHGLAKADQFHGQVRDIKACLALLDSHRPPAENLALCLCWNNVRDELLDFLPAWARPSEDCAREIPAADPEIPAWACLRG